MPTIPDSLASLDRYLLITADSHAGPTPEGYGPYLEKKYQSDYQDWLTWSVENAKIMKQVMGSRSIGVDGDPDVVGYRNWDSKRRLAETEADGVAADVASERGAGVLYSCRAGGESVVFCVCFCRCRHHWSASKLRILINPTPFASRDNSYTSI